jgi:uncharacterized membrane-anchored protein YjiN (DUF445 family)
MLNSQMSDIGSILTNSMLLTGLGSSTSSEKLQAIKDSLQNLPSVLDKDTLQNVINGDYNLTLKQYSDMNTYNTMMNSLYGNKSANKFQNVLNILTDSSEDKLATAKDFIDKMKEKGMSNSTAVKTYSAIQKYSLLTNVGNFNFVNAKA